jgi:hypothetical protein
MYQEGLLGRKPRERHRDDYRARIPRRRLFLRRTRRRFNACRFTLLRFLTLFLVRGMARLYHTRCPRTLLLASGRKS